MNKKNGGFQEWQMNKWGGCASFRNQHRNSLKHSATVGDFQPSPANKQIKRQTNRQNFRKRVFSCSGHQKGFRLEISIN